MFSKIRSPKDFRALFQKGKRRDYEFFRVVFQKNKNGKTRFAFIIPSTVNKRATVRNRLRRRTSEWIRKNYHKRMAQPCDLAIILKKEAVSASRKKFYEELEKVF